MNARSSPASRILARSLLLALGIGVALNLILVVASPLDRFDDVVATLGGTVGFAVDRADLRQHPAISVLLINAAVFSTVAFALSVVRQLRRSRSGPHTA